MIKTIAANDNYRPPLCTVMSFSDVGAMYMTFDNEVSLKDANSEDLQALQNALAIGENGLNYYSNTEILCLRTLYLDMTLNLIYFRFC